MIHEERLLGIGNRPVTPRILAPGQQAAVCDCERLRARVRELDAENEALSFRIPSSLPLPPPPPAIDPALEALLRARVADLERKNRSLRARVVHLAKQLPNSPRAAIRAHPTIPATAIRYDPASGLVYAGAESVALPGHCCVVFSALLAAHPRPVPWRDLWRLLYADPPPVQAGDGLSTRLRSRVSKLRRYLAAVGLAGLVVAQPCGYYRLTLPPDYTIGCHEESA